MMKRCLSLLLAVALIVVLAVPVSADEGNKGSWTDLLEFASVQPDGSNLFKISGTEGTFDILVNPQRRISKVDLLFSYGNGALPSYIGVSYGGSLTKLTVVDLGNNLARAYGNITYAFYPTLSFTVRKSGTADAYYDLLSCKVASISAIDGKASGTLRRSFSDPNPLTLPNNFMVDPASEISGYESKLIPVIITVYADRSFSFITKTPPAPVLIKKACGIETASAVPNKTKVAKLTKEQVQKIAETKMPDLNAASLEAAMSMIAGTARSMGITVEE